MRLATEETWAQLTGVLAPATLTRSIAKVRAQLADQYRHATQQIADWFSPRSDAAAAENTYRIGLELPGVKQDDIEIELHDGVLTVKGEKKTVHTETKEGYFFTERQYGRFQRSFRLPADASGEQSGASPLHGGARLNQATVKGRFPSGCPDQQRLRGHLHTQIFCTMHSKIRFVLQEGQLHFPGKHAFCFLRTFLETSLNLIPPGFDHQNIDMKAGMNSYQGIGHVTGLGQSQPAPPGGQTNKRGDAHGRCA